MGKTLIQIDERVWRYLNKEKMVGESFSEVLERVLEIGKEEDLE